MRGADPRSGRKLHYQRLPSAFQAWWLVENWPDLIRGISLMVPCKGVIQSSQGMDLNHKVNRRPDPYGGHLGTNKHRGGWK